MSPIDKIFYEIYGYLPSKPGTAYEMLSCIAEHVLFDSSVVHDKKIRGTLSESLYQIDVFSENNSDLSVGEAKDYTIQDKKVGRGDLQKLGGALPDLSDASRGRFYSATGFTSPAIKYAKASDSFSGGKGIDLYEFRPSTELDEEGAIKTVCISVTLIKPDSSQARWIPHLTLKGKDTIKEFIESGNSPVSLQMQLETFYDRFGNENLTLFNLTGVGYGDENSDSGSAHGCFLLADSYILFEHSLIEVRGLEYEVPYKKSELRLEINFDSQSRFVVKNAEGEILRFISDQDLKLYKFDESGNLKKQIDAN